MSSDSPLLDLPLDILLYICDEVDPDSRLHFTLACRVLRDVTQSWMLSRRVAHLQHLVDSEQLVLPQKGLTITDLISGRKIGSRRPLLLKLGSSDSDFVKRLYSFYRLLPLLGHVRHIQLQMSWLQSRTQPTYLIATRFTIIMNTIAGRPHSTLTISGNDRTTNSRPSEYLLPQPARTQPYPRGPPIEERFTLPLSENSQLEGFHIHSQKLFSHPFMAWTLHLLNTAPIKVLSFDHIDLTHYDRPHLLSSITIPLLSKLSLGGPSFAFPELEGFLGRHPSITTLELLWAGSIVGEDYRLSSQGLLPRLTHLIADPENLVSLLESPIAFPELSSITIIAAIKPIRLSRPISRASIQSNHFLLVLDYIARRHRKPHQLSLRVLSEVEFDTWMKAFEIGWFRERLHTTLEGVVKLYIDIEDSSLTNDSTFHSHLNFITLFPTLYDISFSGNTSHLDGDNQYFNNALWNTSPKLQVVHIGGRKHYRPEKEKSPENFAFMQNQARRNRTSEVIRAEARNDLMQT